MDLNPLLHFLLIYTFCNAPFPHTSPKKSWKWNLCLLKVKINILKKHIAKPNLTNIYVQVRWPNQMPNILSHPYSLLFTKAKKGVGGGTIWHFVTNWTIYLDEPKILDTEDRRNDKPRLSGLKFIQNHCAKVCQLSSTMIILTREGPPGSREKRAEVKSNQHQPQQKGRWAVSKSYSYSIQNRTQLKKVHIQSQHLKKYNYAPGSTAPEKVS